jgi:hypothetical protein
MMKKICGYARKMSLQYGKKAPKKAKAQIPCIKNM